MGFFDTLFGGGAQKEAANANREEWQNYLNSGLFYSTKALEEGRGALDRAYGEFQPISDLGTKYGKATSLQLDALGANGPEGIARARAAFQQGPGFTETLDQGLGAINRRRAAGGMANSGNADIDALQFGTNLANQGYQNWMTGLGSYVNPELNATTAGATGKAGTLGALGALYGQTADRMINVTGNKASGMANANNQEAAGKQQGANNLLNLGSNLFGGFTKLATGGFF